MFLKSIEVNGFKSFAQKTKFEFHKGITGIVGPNGSGKSNIADAVRWVLGEQKVKQLRSSSMQDVIFAGTENRRPQSFASVALTLDNSDHKLPIDYEEVTVARRVYRSGESEYLLNGSACRLRDVMELFYDTGIGQEGYSIIGQGQIDQILNGRPEERRELFDEAAGIVKYKRRKAVTQKKLENEEKNLTRVNDILSELERQVGPMKKQSENARIYLKKRDALKTLDINLFLMEADRLHKADRELGEKVELAQKQKDETEASHADVISRYQQASEEMQQLEERAKKLRSRQTELEMDRQKAESEIRILEEQIHTIESDNAHFESRKEDLENRIRQRSKAREEYEEEKAQRNSELDDIRERKKEQEKQRQEMLHRIEELEEQNDGIGQKILTLMQNRAQLQKDEQKFVTMKEQADIRKSSLNANLLQRQLGSSDVEDSLQQASEDYEKITSEIRRNEERCEKIDLKRTSWAEKLKDARDKYDELRAQYHQTSSRLESLKNIAERYDGYGNSIRKVMDRKADTPKIHGVVADLISVRKEYETAIETALGGGIRNIVTEDEETARNMIAYLKKNHYGRATFLPMTSVHAPKNVPAADALGEPGVIGLADTLVDTESRYRGIIGHLLGRILVVDTIEHAVALERRHRYAYRIVTLGGESIAPGGAMTGGAFRNNSNLLGRNREMEELTEQVREIRVKGRDLKNHIEEIETADGLLRDERKELNESLQKDYLTQNTAKLQMDRIHDDMRRSETAADEIRKQIQEIDEEKTKIETQRQQVLEELKQSDQQEKELKQEQEQKKKDLEQLRAEASQIGGHVSKLAQEETAAAEKLTFSDENIQRIYRELKQLSDQMDQLCGSAESSDEEITARKEQIQQCRQKIENFGREIQQFKQESEENDRMRESRSAEYADCVQKREDLASDINNLDKELLRLQVRQEKCQEILQEQTDYIWNEYELTYHSAINFRDESMTDSTSLKKEIKKLRSEIHALGPVNVQAIEEYGEIAERYEFMNSQRNDIQEARKSLIQIIDELDDGMRRQFRGKFAEIQQEFNQVFQELFGGGQGTLELTDDDVLESGIRVIAQPPGKKLQNMMQLSGGEKALTAISLLFAIQNLKPSPFCLLDEIEAALDDANVDRYANYLHKLTKHTQFIVITHRRGTMNAADRLYGITMQEKGVSTPVSVDLIESKLDD